MDQKLLFLINREWCGPGLDRLMAVMSSQALWMVPLVLAGLAALCWGGWKGRAFVVVALLTIAVGDGLVGRNLKKAVGRMRPYQTEVGVRQIDLARPAWVGLVKPLKEKFSLGTEAAEDGRSFPSNHTMNTMSIALIAALVFRRGWLALIAAGLVAYSRVYTGAHWPSDVVVSVLLGLGCGLLMLAALEWVWRTYGERLAPRWFAKHPCLLLDLPPSRQAVSASAS